MKYRIMEFPVENADGNRFFVETGHPFKDTWLFTFLIITKYKWEVRSAHKTFEGAMEGVELVKVAEPKHYYIK